MNYGYFLAEDRTRHGDVGLSIVAMQRWDDLGHPAPQRFDGCSMWFDEAGSLQVRLLARDFFSELPRVAQFIASGPHKSDG